MITIRPFAVGVLLALVTSGASTQQPAPALQGVPQIRPDPGWPQLPADWRWGQVIGIFADSRGHVWTSSSSRITEWDAQGKLVQSFDARGPHGNWSTIHGMFVDHNGFVWTNARESNLTVKFTRNGQVVLSIGRYNETGGSNACGIEATFSLGFSHDVPQAYLYSADGGSHVITILRRSDLEVVGEFGGPGVGPGQLGRPHNLSVDPAENIYVAEAAGPVVIDPVTRDSVAAGFRAQKFTFTGTRR
jgi:hypothetical protein